MTESAFGSFALASGEARSWRFGPLTLVACRGDSEWWVWWHDAGDPMTDAVSVAPAEPLPQPPPTVVWRRFITGGDAPLRIEPRLPDRPVVARPRDTVFLPPGEAVRGFVSVPLWLRLAAGERLLAEVPAHRPSDTWFGPSRIDGELCYALRTRFRLQASAEGTPGWRAVVPLTLRNEDEAVSALDRVSVPAPVLALFRGADQRHWTESVTLSRERGASGALRLEDAPPAEAGARPERVAEPRTPAGRRTMFRALGALFGS